MLGEFPSGQERISDVAQIVEIAPSDTGLLVQANEIYDISLGKGYIPPEDLLRYSQDRDHYILIGSVINGKLLGIMLAYPADHEYIKDYNDELEKFDTSLQLQPYSTGIIKSLAVKPEYRHEGIGTKLTVESMKRLQEMSCSLLFAPAWDSGKPDSSPKMFDKLGFNNVLEIPNYWTKDSIEKGYQCPNCGNPCHCKAIYYYKRS